MILYCAFVVFTYVSVICILYNAVSYGNKTVVGSSAKQHDMTMATRSRLFYRHS